MRLYLVSRADLPPGRRAAMFCHAVHAYTERFGQVPPHTTVVLLEVPDLEALEALAASRTGIAVFHEPDFDDELAAVAFDGAQTQVRRLCRDLPLAFVADPKISLENGRSM